MISRHNIEFKIASLNDAKYINTLVNSVYRGENSKKGWTTEAEFLGGIRITEEKIKEIIERNNDIVILAIFDGSITGCVHLENAGEHSYLGMLSVDVDHQDKGIGRLLINECERYTKEEWKLRKIKMKVINRRLELMEYYYRRGYKTTGEIEEFITSAETFGDPTEKLYFETLSKEL